MCCNGKQPWKPLGDVTFIFELQPKKQSDFRNPD